MLWYNYSIALNIYLAMENKISTAPDNIKIVSGVNVNKED